jgi:outer membrane receptor protein involved in Fe transport
VSQLLGIYQDRSKIPLNRRLFDQPEQIANLDLTWARRSSGTSVTLAAFMIGDVLATTGKPFFFDIYEREHTRVDFIFGQQLGSRLKLKLSVKNLTNPQRGLIYDREATTSLVERNTYRLGRDYSGSLSYEF